VHVLGHALHAVVTALVPQLEAAAAAAAVTAGAAPPTAASDKSAAVPVAEKTVRQYRTAPATRCPGESRRCLANDCRPHP